MKKLFFIVFVCSVICYFGCTKGAPQTPACTNALPYKDSAALLAFADDSIHTTFDSSGIFYQILDSGSSLRPSGGSLCSVNYIAKLMSNVIFDSASSSPLGGYSVNQLLPVWQFSLPKIGVGGRIRVLLPSTYGYGCNGYGNVIPPNAPLYYDITLLGVF
jgi:FKBP-type peptidyl-prolyl cis-trans isomerase FkpA